MKRRKVQTEQQLARKRSRAAKKGWRTRRKKQKERSEIERLTRENKELRDTLEAQKDAKQSSDLRQTIITEIHKKTIEEAPLRELLRIAVDEGVMSPEEIKGMGLREQLQGMADEKRWEEIKHQVQRRMDRARRLYGDTLLEAYLLVDMFEEFGFDAIDKIYDLWDSDPEMAA